LTCIPLVCAVLAAGPAAAQPVTPALATAVRPATPARLELQAHDRVVLLGNTLADRQQYFNHFETTLLVVFPSLDLTVRNLSRSGDTMTLQPRPLNFGDAATHLTAQRADVILAFFGLNESFAGEQGLPDFERDLEAYVASHRTARYNGRSAPRLVLVSPIAHETLARLVHVDVDARNRELARYTAAMQRVAARLDVPFADVYTPTLAAMATTPTPLTINGIHLNEHGDRVFAAILATALGLTPDSAALSSKGVTALRGLVHEKNRLFFLRYRPLNAEYVVGRRLDPFGSVNFPPEMKQLDEMIARQERRIWAHARSVAKGSGATPRPSSSLVRRQP